MKTRIIAAIALLCIALGAQAQKHEFANWKRYAESNQALGAPAKGEKRVVLTKHLALLPRVRSASF